MKCFDILEIEKKIEIMDVGAAAIAETPVYKRLIDLDLGNLNAFEGDKRQSQKLKDEFGTNIKLFEKHGFTDLQKKWNENMYAKDKNVILDNDSNQIIGKLIGINNSGQLEIKTDKKNIILSDINYTMRLSS